MANISQIRRWIHRPKIQRTIDIIRQLIHEFWIPFVLTLIWVFLEDRSAKNYSYWQSGTLHFFAVGWLFSQWNRVEKQKRTEKGFINVEAGLSNLLTELKATSVDLEGYSTGGSGFCWIEVMPNYPADPSQLIIQMNGKYPLRDITVRIVDVDRLQSSGTALNILMENRFKIDLLLPEQIITHQLKPLVAVPVGPIRKFDIYSYAPNGFNEQLLRIAVVGVDVFMAIKVVKKNKILFEKIDMGFPRQSDGSVAW